MTAAARILLPDVPALAVGLGGAVWLTPAGEIEDISIAETVRRIHAGERPLLCHLPAVTRRLDIGPFPAYDLLELFAFARPAGFCVPTPRGLAEALDLDSPDDRIGEALALRRVAQRLLRELGDERTDGRKARGTVSVARAMAQGGWAWATAVLATLGEDIEDMKTRMPAAGLDAWRNLPEWSEHAPPAPPGSLPVQPEEARRRLSALLGSGAEPRPSQADYASAVTTAFAPRMTAGTPNMVLAEAGTGVGKTLGYIAPASLWAERNETPVWLSTYTRNLQHQIDQELDRLFPDPARKAQKAVLRKGRENYLCLLNMEDAVKGVAVRRQDATALGLMARWVAATRDGDLTGGDFPAWLVDLLGSSRTTGLADRRGECVYSACSHYTRCFIERGIRRARRAELVIANHALVMVQAARGFAEQGTGPTRIVFDEGHHVFDAADSAFSALLSGRETAELRRWLRGSEGRSRGRARGLKLRAGDLLGEDGAAAEALDAVLRAAAALPGGEWRQRCAEGRPQGPTEAFLVAARSHVLARCAHPDSPYDLEAETVEPGADLLAAAADLDAALRRLEQPMRKLRERLLARLDEAAAELDSATRTRIESIARSLRYRGEDVVAAWRAMLAALGTATPPEFVDWFSIDRSDGRETDIGLHRHWVDPTVPFAATVAAPAHGLVVTSATLRDGSGDVEADWRVAEARSGAAHLPAPAIRAALPSPFPYRELTRVFVVTDVRKDDLTQVAAAYRELFLASGGGGLGLFTAISRLKGVHGRIAAMLDKAGLPLYAQHVDGLNLATLIDIFRAERNACLLGTDAVRDGVDVPGPSLRLIVFDRVPWPRPTILHKARRQAFGGRQHDDMIARLRLKQAYGRLVRRAGDRGVFVLLDPMMPSRLAGAFPEGVMVERLGLAEALRATRGFLAGQAGR